MNLRETNLRETVVRADCGRDLARWFRIALPVILALSLAAGLAPQGRALSQENRIHLGPEGGVLVADDERDCGTLMMHNEGEYYDGAYAWAYDGVVPPYYGAFAECYTGAFEVCSIVLDVTQIGGFDGQLLDAYIWTDGGDVPGVVAYLEPGVEIDPPAMWPSMSRHVVPLTTSTCTGETWWVGYWGNWPGEYFGFAVGASYHTPLPGRPRTCVAPGLGYPEGWQDVAYFWGGTEALGIGAEVNEPPTPPNSATWAQIKGLFR